MKRIIFLSLIVISALGGFFYAVLSNPVDPAVVARAGK